MKFPNNWIPAFAGMTSALFLTLQTVPALAQTQAPVWQKISMGVLEAHFGSLTTSSVTPRILFLNSRDSLYRTLDEGRHWSRVFQLSGNLKSKIHRVYISPHRSDMVYLATSEGLFISRDLGNHFEILFSSAQTDERSCFSVAFHSMDPDILFLGTGNGLFWTLDGGETWNRASSNFYDEEIIKIMPNPRNDRSFLILTRTSLYLLDEKTGALRTLFSIPAENEDPDPDDAIEEESEKINSLNDVAFVPGKNEKILLATQTGILETSGSGWILFPMHGLKSQEISEIIILSSEQIFIATPGGIYRFIEGGKRWEELKNGLDKTDSSDLEYHPSQGGLLYTVTSSGVFKLSLPNPIEMPGIEIENIQMNAENIQFLKNYMNEEPDLRSIHRAAIRYADVNPEKIRNWQRDSRLSHFLPKLSGGLQRATDETVDIDRGATNTSDLFITGPNERSWSYDAGVSWDLAELVWSSSQTSIDSRSKLMTELRNEILSSLTRLYFERKRLVTEFFLKPPSDELLRIELTQHIEELTAHIDAYTGGYFSEEMARRKITSPWEHSLAPGGDEAGRTRH